MRSAEVHFRVLNPTSGSCHILVIFCLMFSIIMSLSWWWGLVLLKFICVSGNNAPYRFFFATPMAVLIALEVRLKSVHRIA